MKVPPPKEKRIPDLIKAGLNWLEMLKSEHDRIVSSNISFFDIRENQSSMDELESRILELEKDLHMFKNIKKSEI